MEKGIFWSISGGRFVGRSEGSGKQRINANVWESDYNHYLGDLNESKHDCRGIGDVVEIFEEVMSKIVTLSDDRLIVDIAAEKRVGQIRPQE